ncbi:hypothetical protein [Lichenicoccus sp.]|uniref:hypothetical protein n=1 Tax=Lichenicoccus sp. TaxID=2781899 RepID=UPI003D0D1775
MGAAKSYHPGWVYHGLVVGTVAVAARLLHAVVTGRLLRPESLTAMLDGRPLPEHRSAEHPDATYGLEGPGSRIVAYAQGNRTAAVRAALPADAEMVARRLLA